jgi:hypothetical protein
VKQLHRVSIDLMNLDCTRLVMWRRRHVNLRTVVALIALTSLVLPGVAAIIEAVL